MFKFIYGLRAWYSVATGWIAVQTDDGARGWAQEDPDCPAFIRKGFGLKLEVES